MVDTVIASERTTLSGQPRSGAELAIAALEANGVDTVFGIPGVHTLALYDALADSNLRHILARHEQGAGFMADGYARATGRPGCTVIITGPGITNIATPVGEAFADSSPVFVLSSNVERPFLDAMRGNLHDLKDQLGVMRAVTKWNCRVMDPADVSDAIHRAFREMTEGRPQPTHVEVPIDVLDEQTTSAPSSVLGTAGPLVPTSSDVADAAARLGRSQRVVIYCGGGANHALAGTAVIRLAERLGAVVVTSTMGKGSVPEDHPLVAGTHWSPGNAVDELVRQADCLLVFGSKLGVQATEHFQFPIPDDVIRVDVDEHEITLNVQPTCAIVGDARVAAEAIDAALESQNIRRQGFTHQQVQAAIDGSMSDAFGLDRKPYIDALRSALPSDSIVAWDMTMMSYTAIRLFPVTQPRTFLFPSGYGTLGFALPAALGAKIGLPDRPVACVVGDGGFQYTMEELGTAVQHRIGVPIIIFNDSTYSAVKDEQRRSRGGRYLGVDLINPDYVQLAAAYGIPGVRAETPEQMAEAVIGALGRDLPTIIDVPIEPWVR